MSTFAVIVEQVLIEEHTNADALEIAHINDYQSIVRKGQFKTGDLVAYIPEQALVPEALLEEMGLSGRLAGKNKNRVKAVKLRGVLSQGIVYPARPEWPEGADVTEVLGITKWEPPVPANLAGEVYSAGLDRTLRYDIENVKKFPRVLEAGEQVVFTEKLHGTWCMIGLVPKTWAHPEHGRLIVSSKGLASRGLAMKPNSERNKENLYIRVARHLNMEQRISFAFGRNLKDLIEPVPVFVLGEVFGSGVQDLGYGAKTDKDVNIGFRVFDVFVGKPGVGRYLNDKELDEACKRLGLERVPVLYRGPFWHSTMSEYTDGKETVSGKAMHIREGIVIRPQLERRHDEIGRVQLKSVSGTYLTRKGNTTEFN
jgi:RNA ligase (TIGR02306 family)